MTGWGADWSYSYLRGLMAKIGESRRFATLSTAPIVLGEAAIDPKPVAFIRHDVDISLARARVLAEREAQWGVVATYHVMMSCPFYDVASRESRDALRAIHGLGHEIGLHFHPPVDGELLEADAAEAAVDNACARFTAASGFDARSVSFHMPATALIGGPLMVAGRVNAYAKPLLEWYLSDSRARWREGDPLVSLDAPRAKHLQLLVHPLWWGEENQQPALRLHELVEELANERNETASTIGDLVYEHILVRSDGTPSRR